MQRQGGAPTSVAEFRFLPGIEEAIHRLQAGFCQVVITNRRDVAIGLSPPAECEVMNDEIRRRLPIDGILVCFDTDAADNCFSRKLKPGRILGAAAKHDIDLAWLAISGET